MAKIVHINNSVGFITTMPFKYPGYGKAGEYEEFEDFLKTGLIKNYKYLLGFTANKFQERPGLMLKNQGFRAVKHFLSSHGNLDETLTLWVKIQNDYLKDGIFPQVLDKSFPYNCSVTFSRSSIGIVCNWTVINDEENEKEKTIEDLKKLGFKRVKNTPIYFHIDKKYLVEEVPKNPPAPEEVIA